MLCKSLFFDQSGKHLVLNLFGIEADRAQQSLVANTLLDAKCAVELTKSDRVRNLFPAGYVDECASRFHQTVGHDQFASMIEANQLIESNFLSAMNGMPPPNRAVLE